VLVFKVQDTITTRFRNSKYSRKFTSKKKWFAERRCDYFPNKKSAYSLQKINLFLRPESEKWITIEGKKRKVAEI
jgi:hypothetical protein